MSPTGDAFVIHAHGLASQPLRQDATPAQVAAVYKELTVRVDIQRAAQLAAQNTTLPFKFFSSQKPTTT